jgi:hypothetical protein
MTPVYILDRFPAVSMNALHDRKFIVIGRKPLPFSVHGSICLTPAHIYNSLQRFFWLVCKWQGKMMGGTA